MATAAAHDESTARLPQPAGRLTRLRYRATRGVYRVQRRLGRPDFVDELDFWESVLRPPPAHLFDPAVRAAAFPPELRSRAAGLRDDLGRVPLLLEVGSGPVSILAGGVDEGLVRVVAVDPLARPYGDLLEICGIRYPIRPVPGRGEELGKRFGEGVFDIVYSSNALDHTTAPRLCVEQMTALLRPGGLLLLEGLAHEGSQAQWAGLHQHDLFPESGSLIHESRDGTRSDLTAGLALRCVSEQVTVFRDRGIGSFGYEIPEGGLADGAVDWRDRDWYTVLWERT